MDISAALISTVARKLFRHYLSEGAEREIGDLLLGSTSIEEFLTELIAQKFLDFGDATEESDFTDELLTVVINKIKDIQRDAGILKGDGVLAAKTLKWFRNRRFGHHHRDIDTLPKSTKPVSPGDGIHAIRYFVDNDELPKVAGLSAIKTLQLFDEAWDSWADVCNINVKQSRKRSEANVIVNVRVLSDQPPSVLAIADVGPPRNRQLELTFDKAENWTPFMFEATACHEMGHILGIRHRNVRARRQLMNDTLHDDIKEPQTEDAKAAESIWGPSQD